MLNLDFTEEQDMLRDMVCGVCEQLSPLAVEHALASHAAVGSVVAFAAPGFQLAAFRFAPPASVSGSANAKAHAASVSAKLTTNGSRRDAV